MAARERGLSYTQLIGRIVESAATRNVMKVRPEKPAPEKPAADAPVPAAKG